MSKHLPRLEVEPNICNRICYTLLTPDVDVRSYNIDPGSEGIELELLPTLVERT
jgi:hypothetical protein